MNAFLSKIDRLRIIAKMLYDFSVACFAFWLALYMRYGGFPDRLVEDVKFNRFFFLSMGLHFMVFFYSGLYKGIWGFTSINDLIRVIRASLVAAVGSLALCFLMTRLEDIPRTMFGIHFLLLVIGLGGGRLAYRFLKDYFTNYLKLSEKTSNVLIIGAERAGEKLLRKMFYKALPLAYRAKALHVLDS